MLLGDKVLYEKVIFDQTQDENIIQPKNFTIIFKYIGSETSPNISYAHFNVQNAVNVSFSLVKTHKHALYIIINICRQIFRQALPRLKSIQKKAKKKHYKPC